MLIEQAYKNHRIYLMKLVQRKFYSIEAEDIIQDLFVSLKQDNLNKAPNKLAYLTRAAYNKAIDQLPKQYKSRTVDQKLYSIKPRNRKEKLILQMLLKGQTPNKIRNVLKMNYRLDLKLEYVKRIIWDLKRKVQ